MKRLITAFALLVCLSSLARASGVQAPLDQKGNTLQTSDWIGTLPFNLNSATGTTAVELGLSVPSSVSLSESELNITTGRSIVYGVIVSSISATDYLVFRDSNTANVTSSTAAIVYAWNSLNGGAASNPLSGQFVSGVITFPRPIEFFNGVSVNDANAPTAGAINSWTILWRPTKSPE